MLRDYSGALEWFCERDKVCISLLYHDLESNNVWTGTYSKHKHSQGLYTTNRLREREAWEEAKGQNRQVLVHCNSRPSRHPEFYLILVT